MREVLRRALPGALLIVACVPTWALAQSGTHVVRPGDTLTSLARRYDTSVGALREVNALAGDLLRVGEHLRLPGPPGWREESVGETEGWPDVARRTGVPAETLRDANPAIVAPAGNTVRVPPGPGTIAWPGPGEDLIALATRLGVAPGALARRNGLSAPYRLAHGTPLLLPEGARADAAEGATNIAAAADRSREARADHDPGVDRRDAHGALRDAAFTNLAALFDGRTLTPPDDGFGWPLADARRITSRFGWRSLSVAGNRYHQGIDLGATPGTLVRASRDGVVTRAGWTGAYGYAVYLAHEGGFETRYAHLSLMSVSVGDRVVRGGEVGRVGSTGASTGPHLHFEARRDGRALDPLEILPRLP